MTTFDDLSLTTAPAVDQALYDRFGNRYVFNSYREYEVARRNQIIAWLTKDSPLCFL